MKPVYFNNSSTTKMLPSVVRTIKRSLKNYANPSDILVEPGAINYRDIEIARNNIAVDLHCSPNDIYFTASGSEGDNMCLKSLAFSNRNLTGKNKIIVSAIEHKAILNSAKFLEQNGFNVCYVKPDQFGIVESQSITDIIDDNTILVSLMYVNNILGTIQPIREVGNFIAKYNSEHGTNILFHSDMVQALGNTYINLDELPVHAATFSSHKIHGPKFGFVYINRHINFDSFIHGGGQELGKRAGTENLPYILGTEKAVEYANYKIGSKQYKISQLKYYLLEQLYNNFTNIRINSLPRLQTANVISLCFEELSGDMLVQALGTYDIYTSAGSACNTSDGKADYVLEAIGVPGEYINGALRISINEFNTLKECKYFIKCLKKCLLALRGYV